MLILDKQSILHLSLVTQKTLFCQHYTDNKVCQHYTEYDLYNMCVCVLCGLLQNRLWNHQEWLLVQNIIYLMNKCAVYKKRMPLLMFSKLLPTTPGYQKHSHLKLHQKHVSNYIGYQKHILNYTRMSETHLKLHQDIRNTYISNYIRNMSQTILGIRNRS